MSSPSIKPNSTHNSSTTTKSTNQGSSSGGDEVNVRIAVSVVLMIIIIVGNLLVILAYKINHRLRTGTYTFLVSLAISDFLVGSVALPLWIYVSARGWRALPDSVSIFYLGLDIFSALASTFHLTAVSVERFIAISKPFYYKTIPIRSYFVWICVAYTLAFILTALHPKIVLSAVENPSEKLILIYRQVHSVILFTCGYLAPMILITTVNIGIFKIAKKLIRSSARPSQANIEDNMTSFTRRRLPKERKTAITLVMITGLFFLAWLPFFVVNMLSLFCLKTCFVLVKRREDLFALVEFTKWLHYSNSAINAVVYAFRDIEMRRTFISIILPFCEYRAHRIGPGNLDTNFPRTRNSSSAAYCAEYLKNTNRVELEVPNGS